MGWGGAEWYVEGRRLLTRVEASQGERHYFELGRLVVRKCGALRSRVDVLADDSRVACRDTQQRESGTVGLDPILLPVAKRMNADTERLRKLLLSETDETSQRGHVAGLKPTCNDSHPLRSSERPAKFFSR